MFFKEIDKFEKQLSTDPKPKGGHVRTKSSKKLIEESINNIQMIYINAYNLFSFVKTIDSQIFRDINFESFKNTIDEIGKANKIETKKENIHVVHLTFSNCYNKLNAYINTNPLPDQSIFKNSRINTSNETFKSIFDSLKENETHTMDKKEQEYIKQIQKENNDMKREIEKLRSLVNEKDELNSVIEIMSNEQSVVKKNNIRVLENGFPGGSSSKEPSCQCRRHKCVFDP